MYIKIILLLFGFVFFSLLFFSRGILIFLAILCLSLASQPQRVGATLLIQIRWVFFALFCFHIFGDIFLGRTVRRIKFFDVLAIIFIIYALLSAAYSPYPYLTLERAATLLALYISIFWIIWKYAYDRSPERVISLMLQAMTLIFIAGYLMIFMVPLQAFSRGRFIGVFGNPNILGIICAITLPLYLWQFLETKRQTALYMFFLVLLALLLSGARAAMNATVLSLAYFLFVPLRKYKPLTVPLLMAIISILVWFIENMIKKHFLIYIRAESIPILGGRLEIWPLIIDLIIDKPIFGYGFGIEDKIIDFKKLYVGSHYGHYVHNSYLGIILQLGIFGFIILFVPLFILLFKELFSRQDSDVPRLRYALRASLISGLVYCFYESWIYSVGSAATLPFWIIIMLLTFYRCQDKEKIMPEST